MCVCVCVSVCVCVVSLCLSVSICVYLSICLCVHREAIVITSDMIWTPYGRLNRFYNYNMAVIINIISRHGLNIDVHSRNVTNLIRVSYHCIRH